MTLARSLVNSLAGSSARLVTRIKRGPVRAAIDNLFWLASERMTQLAVTIVVSGLLARYFGPEGFGQWQYANNLLTVLAPLTWVCGAEILVPTIVAASAKAGDRIGPSPRLGTIIGSAFALRMSVAIVTVLAVWSVIAIGQRLGRTEGLFNPTVSAMLAGLAATMLFREPFAVVNAWLQAQTRSKPALLLTLTAAWAKALLVWLLVRLAWPSTRFGWLWALETGSIALGLVLYYRYCRANASNPQRRLTTPLPAFARWRIDASLLKHFAHAGSVFWLALICMYVFMKIDRLMLERYVGFAELGRYAAAQQLNENWTTLAMMLAQTVAPAFIYSVNDTATLRRHLRRLLLLTGLIMSTGAALIAWSAGPLIHLVFGHGFDSAVAFLRWSAWLSVPAGLDAICNLVMLKYQAKYVVLVKWMLALATTFLANLWLIPAYGGYGALAGLLCGYGSALSVDAWYIRRALSGRIRTLTTPPPSP